VAGSAIPAVEPTESPILGPGSEVFGFVTGWSWCGYCGYTGRCKGPRQQACQQAGWHAWLEQCADALPPT
jgi:hypothetical protein